MTYAEAMSLYEELQAQLLVSEEKAADLLQSLSRGAEIVKAKLRELLRNGPAASSEDGPAYFKVIYPLFYGQLLYHQDYFNLEIGCPLFDGALQLEYYHGELKILERLFSQNHYLYAYYKRGGTSLDQYYFTRGSGVEALDLLPKYDTGQGEDYPAASIVFSKFIAGEKLRTVILQKISLLSRSSDPASVAQPGLRWTGESINLVELAYGIWLTGQINHGNATITEIIAWLETSLGIPIGRPYKRWTQIAQRKSVSTTRFIDELGLAIRQRLDRENSL